MKTFFLALTLLAMPPALWGSPLFIAIEKGNKVQAKKLVMAGASGGVDINEKLGDGTTPLLKAIKMGNNTIVELLVTRGADLNLADNEGITPLMAAASKNDVAISKLLLSRRVKVNEQSKEGKTALFYFAANGNKEMLVALMDKGANVNVVDSTGDSPLHLAALSGKVSAFLLILSKMSPENEKDPMTPFLLAAYMGNKKQVTEFLATGEEANTVNAFGETPLFWAVRGGHAPVAEVLVANGGDAKSMGGHIYFLMRNKKYDLVKQLILGGADVNNAGAYNYTPLMEAVNGNQVELIQLMLDKGANPNARDVEGYTALMFATKKGAEKSLAVLLNAANLDLDQANNHGVNALSGCIYPKASKKMIEMLLKAGCKPVTGKPEGGTDCIFLAKKRKCPDLIPLLEKYNK